MLYVHAVSGLLGGIASLVRLGGGGKGWDGIG